MCIEEHPSKLAIITIIKICSYLSWFNHEETIGLLIQVKLEDVVWKVSSFSKYEKYITGGEVLAQICILKIEALMLFTA